jgi:YD repeat-containing protein
MVSDNIVSIPVEVKRYKNSVVGDSLLTTLTTNYSGFNKQFIDPPLIAPREIISKVKNDPNVRRIGFNYYDNHGNILEQQNIDGTKDVYLWGYWGQHPVAKIVGSDFATVKQKVDTSSLYAGNDTQIRQQFTNLRNGFSSNPNVQISTFTYKPFIGMTTATDPQGVTTNYTYDTFNRLFLTRDDDKNILARYRYGYQNEPDNGMGGYTAPSAVISVNASSYTLGVTGSATASASGGSGGYTYNWYLETSSGAVLSSSLNTTSTSFSFTCSQTGTLTVQCVVTDNLTGQTATSNKTITCNAALTASLSCALRFTQNATGTATVTATGGSGSYYYSWDFKDSSGTDLSISNHTTSTSFSFVCSEAGSMTLQCVVTDNQTGQSVTLTKTITVISNGGPPD